MVLHKRAQRYLENKLGNTEIIRFRIKEKLFKYTGCPDLKYESFKESLKIDSSKNWLKGVVEAFNLKIS
jgi:hypothetical protein